MNGHWARSPPEAKRGQMAIGSRLVVVAQGGSEAEKGKFSEHLSTDVMLAWWHWMPDVWLIVDAQFRTPAQWLEIVRSIMPGTIVLVTLASTEIAGWIAVEGHEWISDQWEKI